MQVVYSYRVSRREFVHRVTRRSGAQRLYIRRLEEQSLEQAEEVGGVSLGSRGQTRVDLRETFFWGGGKTMNA